MLGCTFALPKAEATASSPVHSVTSLLRGILHAFVFSETRRLKGRAIASADSCKGTREQQQQGEVPWNLLLSQGVNSASRRLGSPGRQAPETGAPRLGSWLFRARRTFVLPEAAGWSASRPQHCGRQRSAFCGELQSRSQMAMLSRLEWSPAPAAVSQPKGCPCSSNLLERTKVC